LITSLLLILSLFLFTATSTTQISTLSLHDALPIYAFLAAAGGALADQERAAALRDHPARVAGDRRPAAPLPRARRSRDAPSSARSEEHTSELQSRSDLVCRLLLEKKNKQKIKKSLQ